MSISSYSARSCDRSVSLIFGSICNPCRLSGHPAHGPSPPASTEVPPGIDPRMDGKLHSHTGRTDAFEAETNTGIRTSERAEGAANLRSGRSSTALHEMITGYVGSDAQSATSTWKHSGHTSATLDESHAGQPSSTDGTEANSPGACSTTDATSVSLEESDASSDQTRAGHKAISAINGPTRKMYACQDCDRSECFDLCCSFPTHAAACLYRQD